jgi:hypothetical protein
MSRHRNRLAKQNRSNRLNFCILDEQARLQAAGYEMPPFPIDQDLIPRIVKQAFDNIEKGENLTRKGTAK